MLDYILLNIAGTGDVNHAFIPLLLVAGQAAMSIGKGVRAAKAAKEATIKGGGRGSGGAEEGGERNGRMGQGDLKFQPA